MKHTYEAPKLAHQGDLVAATRNVDEDMGDDPVTGRLWVGSGVGFFL